MKAATMTTYSYLYRLYFDIRKVTKVWLAKHYARVYHVYRRKRNISTLKGQTFTFLSFSFRQKYIGICTLLYLMFVQASNGLFTQESISIIYWNTTPWRKQGELQLSGVGSTTCIRSKIITGQNSTLFFKLLS